MLYRTVNLENKSIIIDAKQRILLNKSDPHHDGERILCIEPPPDVAQAISSALSLKNQDGDAMISLNESIIQLGERLAVMQLLRDRMYRACEAYANGAIDRVSYVLMLARIDKTMITLLSQEMIAGAFRGRKLAPVAGDDMNTTESPDAMGMISPDSAASDQAVAKVMHAIYRDYVDDDGLEPLVDACVGAMNHSFDRLDKIRRQIRVGREIGFRLEALKAEMAVMEDAQTEVESLITQYNKIAPSDSLTLFGMNAPTILDDDSELDKAIDEVIMKLKDKDTELLKDLKVIKSSESPTTKENAFIDVCVNQVFGKRAKGGFVSLRHKQEKILRELNFGDKVKERLKMLESDLTAHVHD
ncbi:hypothetical protein [Candidatus Spongiihabitans sp.]|uniref:hypothetical protein n=1 Tax=Candidatus Spongiihabitans sp. TaxID=3101308 RepID=UPI003C6FEB42